MQSAGSMRSIGYRIIVVGCVCFQVWLGFWFLNVRGFAYPPKRARKSDREKAAGLSNVLLFCYKYDGD